MNEKPMKGSVDSSITRYVDFLNSVPVALYRSTIEGKLVYCNRTFGKLFGYDSPDALIGQPVIKLYRNKKDRGMIIHSILQRGQVIDLPVPFVKTDGSSIWCAVTAKAVLDDDGIVIHLDGALRDITGEIHEQDTVSTLSGVTPEFDDILLYFDLQGNIFEINQTGVDLFGVPKNDILGRSVSDFISPQRKELFYILLADILKFGSEEVVLTVLDNEGDEHIIELHAMLVKKDGQAHHIKGIAQDITKRIQMKKDQLMHERFQGVLEMAGGVAHSLNQPLTIINNLLNDVAENTKQIEPVYRKVEKVTEQVNKMNDIIKKIANIKKYASMEYVAGIKIVDIDKAS